jgi:hypothetical protein
LFGQRHAHGPPPQAKRALIQNFSKSRQLFRVQALGAQVPLFFNSRTSLCCFRHESLVSTGEPYYRCWAKRNLRNGAGILNISACKKQLKALLQFTQQVATAVNRKQETLLPQNLLTRQTAIPAKRG